MRSTPRRWSFQLFLAAVVMVLTCGSTGVGQASAQNGAVQPPGAISGVVLDATTKQPVRNALVQLSGPNAGGRLTDERGRFIFLGVAPGSYTLRVTKAGYFEPALFARSSPPLSVGPSQWLADQQIAIVRQGSIAGRVVDERGEPMVGARVRVFAEVPIAGRVRLARGPAAGTDDRGVYRITGLPEGRYHVVVPSVQQAVPAGTPAAVIAGQSVAQAAKSAGAAIVERPTVESASGHRLVVGSALIPPPPDGSGRSQAYPITFYPSASAIAASSPIALGAGQQRDSVDLQLRPVPTFQVSGRVDGPPAIVTGIPLRLLPAGSEDLGGGSEAATTLVASDGSFTFLNVPAGRYTIDARPSWVEYDYPRAIGGTTSTGGVLAPTPGGRSTGASGSLDGAPAGTWYGRGRGDWGQTVWISADIGVADTDLTDVTVPVQRTGRISGRIEWERTAAPPLAAAAAPAAPRSQQEARVGALTAAMAKTTIRAEPADGSPSLGLPTGIVSPDNSFAIDGLLAGAYVIRVGTPAVGGPVSIKSIVWRGTDLAHTPIEMSAGLDAADVVVTLIDRTQSIRGRVTDVPPGRIAVALAFPVDPKRWLNYGLQSPLIRSGGVGNDTTYQLTLPAGDFHVVAVDQAQAAAWSEPGFLEAAARAATRVSLAWGETKSQDVPFVDVRVPR